MNEHTKAMLSVLPAGHSRASTRLENLANDLDAAHAEVAKLASRLRDEADALTKTGRSFYDLAALSVELHTARLVYRARLEVTLVAVDIALGTEAAATVRKAVQS